MLYLFLCKKVDLPIAAPSNLGHRDLNLCEYTLTKSASTYSTALIANLFLREDI